MNQPIDARRRVNACAATLLLMVVGTVALVGCPSDTTTTDDDAPPPACTLAFQGDPNAAPQVEIVYSGTDGLNHPVAEGGELPMLLPPQGGRVAYVGARVTNIDPCSATLSGSVRDEITDQVRLDIRTVNLTPQGDGWAESAPGNLSVFSNVPLCPNQWSDQNLFDGTYLLDVKVTDRAGRVAEAQAHVKPSCGEPSNEADCRCICKAGYVLGESCNGTSSSSSASTGAGGAGG